MARTHWFGEDVETINTTLDALPAQLPVFERQPFGRNRFRDVIIRRSPAGTSETSSIRSGGECLCRTPVHHRPGKSDPAGNE